MYSAIISAALFGVEAVMVSVEVDVSQGLPSFAMVGSLSSEVKESKERVLSALCNMGFNLPPMRVTVNLSPADLKKDGTAYDLPIAVGLLQSLGYFKKEETENTLFLGELGLNGEIKPVRGVLPIVREAAKCGISHCIVPLDNSKEGGVIPNMQVRGISHLEDLILFLQASEADKNDILPVTNVDINAFIQNANEQEELDFNQIRGQESAKRASLIAAAGFHNLLMTGPPGAGKSMIAKRIPGILPPLTVEEGLEVTTIYSVAGRLEGKSFLGNRPFQSPHHTISTNALIGGGRIPRPGMLSLAHRGVLFLDELTEFSSNAIDAMRQPIEDRKVQIARVYGNMVYPTDFMLVCAMNPCPCGFYPDRNRCSCTLPQIKRYLGKISGPILDRIDLCVELQKVDIVEIQEQNHGVSSKQMKEIIIKAREMQKQRFLHSKYQFNSEISAADIGKYCSLGKSEKQCVEELYHTMDLSARSYHRILRVARTIADLEECENIEIKHLLEAACYRPSQSYFI